MVSGESLTAGLFVSTRTTRSFGRTKPGSGRLVIAPMVARS